MFCKLADRGFHAIKSNVISRVRKRIGKIFNPANNTLNKVLNKVPLLKFWWIQFYFTGGKKFKTEHNFPPLIINARLNSNLNMMRNKTKHTESSYRSMSFRSSAFFISLHKTSTCRNFDSIILYNLCLTYPGKREEALVIWSKYLLPNLQTCGRSVMQNVSWKFGSDISGNLQLETQLAETEGRTGEFDKFFGGKRITINKCLSPEENLTAVKISTYKQKWQITGTFWSGILSLDCRSLSVPTYQITTDNQRIDQQDGVIKP